MLCKTCKQDKEVSNFSQIKRKTSITYRQSCKSCEYDKALARKFARGGVDPAQPATAKETDPAFLIDDEYARMPSDGDLLFWSTDFYETTENRKVLRNRTPEDK